MSLNIKSEEADRLVLEVTRITGESKTQAVVESLKERLERVKAEANEDQLVGDLLRIGEKCASYTAVDDRDHGIVLYDDDGLP